MIPSHPLLIFPAQLNMSIEQMIRLLQRLQLASELEEDQESGLRTQQETVQLFQEQREGHHAMGSIRMP